MNESGILTKNMESHNLKSGKNLLKSFLNLIYPLNCPICRKKLNMEEGNLLCEDCLSKIEYILPPSCYKCGKPLSKEEKEGRFCANCKKKEYHFHRARSACIYEGALRECIHLLKYKGKLKLVEPLAKLLIEFIERFRIPVDRFDLIVPIPLHPLKRWKREFNQAELLAKRIAEKFNLSLSLNNLWRNRATRSQSQLNRQERLENVKGAFSVRNPEQFHNKNVILFDDLFTTGATANEASFILRQARAKQIEVLTLATTRQ